MSISKNSFYRSICNLLILTLFFQSLAFASDSEKCADVLAPVPTPAPVSAPAPAPEEHFYKSQIYNLLLRAHPSFSWAVDFLEEAEKSESFRKGTEEVLKSSSFAKRAAQIGLEYKTQIDALVEETYPNKYDRYFLLNMLPALWMDYDKFKRENNKNERLLTHSEASRLARDTIIKTYGKLPRSTNPIDAFGHEIAKEYAKRTTIYELTQTAHGKASDAEQMKEVRKWISRTVQRIQMLRARNLIDLLRDISQSLDRPIAFTQEVEGGEPGTVVWGELEFTDIEKWKGELGGLHSEAPSIRLYKGPVAFGVLGKLGKALTYGLPNALRQAKRHYFRNSEQAFRHSISEWSAASKKDRLYLQNDFLLSLENIEDLIRGVILEHTNADQLKTELLDARLSFRKDIELHLREQEETLSQMAKLAKLVWFETALLKQMQSWVTLRNEGRRAKAPDSLARLWTLPNARGAKDFDFVDSLEWFGYFRHPNHWISRDASVAEQKHEGVFRAAKLKVKDAYLKRTEISKLTISAGTAVSLLASAGVGLAVTVGYLAGHISGSVTPDWVPDFLRKGEDPPKTVSIPKRTNASNDAEAESNPAVGFAVSFEDPRHASSLPRYFEYPDSEMVADTANTQDAKTWGIFEILDSKQTADVFSSQMMTPDEHGRLPVPVPRGFHMTSLDLMKVNLKKKNTPETETFLFPDVDWALKQHLPTQTFFVELKSDFKDQLYRIHLSIAENAKGDEPLENTSFSSTTLMALPYDPRFDDLDKDRLLKEIDLMRDAYLTNISEALRSEVLQKERDKKPITVLDIERVFEKTQAYSHDPEAWLSVGTWFTSNPFAEEQKFLHNGRLYYECDGGNGLLQKFWKIYYQNDPDIEVFPMPSFVLQKHEDGIDVQISGYFSQIYDRLVGKPVALSMDLVTSPSHVRTMLYSKRTGYRIILDGTPIGTKQPEDFEKKLGGPRYLPAALPAPEQEPVQRKVKKRKLNFAQRTERHQKNIERLDKALNDLSNQKLFPGMQEVPQLSSAIDLHNQRHVPKVAYQVAKLMLAYAKGEERRYFTKWRLEEITAISLDPTKPMKDLLTKIAETQMQVWANALKFKKNSPWVSDASLRMQVELIFSILSSYGWAPPDPDPVEAPTGS